MFYQRFQAAWEIGRLLLIVFIVAVMIRVFVFQPFAVEGSSMEPNFHHGEYLLITKLPYRFGEPNRGDVVVFRYPRDPRVNYIKRIIGLPGETLRIQKGRIYINDKLLEENYLVVSTDTVVDGDPDMVYEVELGKNQYFVMGDNRSHSSDSRVWGPLERRFIIGKSSLVLYPQSSFRAIASPQY